MSLNFTHRFLAYQFMRTVKLKML